MFRLCSSVVVSRHPQSFLWTVSKAVVGDAGRFFSATANTTIFQNNVVGRPTLNNLRDCPESIPLCSSLIMGQQPKNFLQTKMKEFFGDAGRCYSATTIAPMPQNNVVERLTLNMLSDFPEAIRRKRRVGRGIGSSKGKTCGRGHKGQKSRSGRGIPRGFEGGQTKFYKRIPKRGFTNIHSTPMTPISLGKIQDYIDMGRLIVPKASEKPWDMLDFVNAGIVKTSRIKHGMKLLSTGKERLRTPFRIEISRASQAAIKALEKIGGEVVTVHYNRLALRALLKPHKFEIIPRRALPSGREKEYYTDYKKRGYLSAEIQKKKLFERLEKRMQENKSD